MASPRPTVAGSSPAGDTQKSFNESSSGEAAKTSFSRPVAFHKISQKQYLPIL
jgi:hypothetical protein